jgi:hypothetical protein
VFWHREEVLKLEQGEHGRLESWHESAVAHHVFPEGHKGQVAEESLQVWLV